MSLYMAGFMPITRELMNLNGSILALYFLDNHQVRASSLERQFMLESVQCILPFILYLGLLLLLRLLGNPIRPNAMDAATPENTLKLTSHDAVLRVSGREARWHCVIEFFLGDGIVSPAT